MLMTIWATTNQHQVRSLLIGCLKNCNKQYKFPSVARLFEIDFRYVTQLSIAIGLQMAVKIFLAQYDYEN